LATRSEVQKAYERLAGCESELNQLIDEIPYAVLGSGPGPEHLRTGDALRQAAEKLDEVVRLLEGVRDAEAPRYERSPLANSPVSTGGCVT
jgi:hypothetical protein